ncbi:MAG: N-acetyltransferase family protein [Paenisporosarcina sp.]
MAKRMENKYIPLADYFLKATLNEVKLTYTALENIIGQQLPNAAYLNSSWWKKTKPPAMHFQAWTDADYYVKEIVLGRTVTFAKTSDMLSDNNIDQTKSVDILIIRPVDLEDARSIIQLQQAIYSETDFMLFGIDDRRMTVQSIRKQIGEWKKSLNSSMFVGILNGEFAGFIVILGGPAPRASHRASLVIGVRKAFHGKNVGTALIKKAESWAKEINIERMELTVMENNERAIYLYKKMGYLVEGTRSHALKINNEFVNEYYMGKLI